MVKELSLQEFKVRMSVFDDAIGAIDTQSRKISTILHEISDTFKSVETDWRSPAADTFGDLATEYQSDATDLNDLLADILIRMRQTYKNYLDVESKAEANLKGQESHR